jgi:hypothetical protein
MLDIAYQIGARKALEEMTKEAFWKAPLLGAMADSAYSNILDNEFDGNQATPALRGALTGAGVGLGWQLGGKHKLLASALGGIGSRLLADNLSQRG